eukprot:TRINITY_DN8627_c0_g1_i2.p1 TRINITY_DN8627_c0_g1~~TRINITY_DN8627_c0_g1_i2.p1  ORF type:complete len:492 (-),score=99.65 TRINITY_DN8627_c0_g1_i2:10-1485(-)
MAARPRGGLRLLAAFSLVPLLLLLRSWGPTLQLEAYVGAAGSFGIGSRETWPQKGSRWSRPRTLCHQAQEEWPDKRESSLELWPKLFDWVKGTGMDTSDIAIEVAPVDLAPGELGLVAQQRLDPGDILAWAPKKNLLTPDKAVELWGEDYISDLPERTAVALLLVHERFNRKTESFWHIYFQTLPNFVTDVAGPSFLWTEAEQKRLQGSDCYGASVAMRDTFEEEFQELQEELFAKRPAEFPESAFTLTNFLWACAVVSSRAYADDEDGEMLALAPLVDFLNHQSGALQLTRFSNGIVAYGHKAYDPGEQVYVNYGAKSNAQLLSQYGFVEVDNTHEAVYLRVGPHLELKEPLLQEKVRLLDELVEPLGQEGERAIFKLALRMREWDTFLMPALRILTLDPERPVPESSRDMLPMQEAEHEARAWQLFLETLTKRQADYPATLETDRELLASGELQERHELALKLRITEQELLALATERARDRVEDFAENA